MNAIQTDFLTVPYKGTGPAMNDLIGGHVDVMFSGISSARPYMDAGTLRALAVTGETRNAAVPQVPTFAEAGLAGVSASTYWGVLAPKGTPKEIVTKLNAAAVEALNDPAVKKQLESQGLEMTPKDQLTPEALGARQKAEIAKWWPIIKAADIKVD